MQGGSAGDADEKLGTKVEWRTKNTRRVKKKTAKIVLPRRAGHSAGLRLMRWRKLQIAEYWANKVGRLGCAGEL